MESVIESVVSGYHFFSTHAIENKMTKQKQRQSQKQVVIVNVGATKKRKTGGKRKARSAPAPAIMVQQVIPPIPLSVQPQPQADFATQFMKALAGMGEGVTVKKDTVAPPLVLNNPNNASILKEQQAIQTTKGIPWWEQEQELYKPVKASESAVSETEGKEEMMPMTSLGNVPMMNQPAIPSQSMSSAEAIQMYGPPVGMPPAFSPKEIKYRIRTDADGRKYREENLGSGWRLVQYKGEKEYTKIPPFPGLASPVPMVMVKKDGTVIGTDRMIKLPKKD